MFFKAANTSVGAVMIFYAILRAIDALLGIFLPETKDREIPDTIKEVENLGEQKVMKSSRNS